MQPHDLTPDDPLAERLVAYVDGELAPADAADVERLLAERPELARQADLLRRTGDLIGTLPRESGHPELASRVRDRARTPQTASAPGGRLLTHPAFRLAAAACLVLGIALGARHLLEDGARPADIETAVVLSREEERAIARDLDLLRNLDALQSADAEELRMLVDDLDLLDAIALEEQEG